MAKRNQFRTEHVQEAPRGWRVKTLTTKTGHEVRLAFPPGRRKRGSGRLVSILHPHGENPESCHGPNRHMNPSELLILGANPSKGKGTGNKGQKNPKVVSEEQVAAKQQKAIDFLDRIDADDPNGIADMSVQEYAEHKGLKIADRAGNPAELSEADKAAMLAVWRMSSGHADKRADRLAWSAAKFSKTVSLPYMRVYKALDHLTRQNPKIERRKSQARKAGKRNPPAARRRRNAEGGSIDEGKDLYRAFHGKEPREVADLAIKNEVQQNYVALGDLLSAKFLQEDGRLASIKFAGDKIVLAASTEGEQLYCIGGNQNMLPALEELGYDASKDLISMGRWHTVVYMAAKSQTNFELTEWTHDFGCVDEIAALMEESDEKGWSEAEFQSAVKRTMDAVPPLERDLPEAVYDKRNERILWAGGSYYVDWPGIVG